MGRDRIDSRLAELVYAAKQVQAALNEIKDEQERILTRRTVWELLDAELLPDARALHQ